MWCKGSTTVLHAVGPGSIPGIDIYFGPGHSDFNGCKSHRALQNGVLSEWLRRRTTNPLGFARESSNLSDVVYTQFLGSASVRHSLVASVGFDPLWSLSKSARNGDDNRCSPSSNLGIDPVFCVCDRVVKVPVLRTGPVMDVGSNPTRRKKFWVQVRLQGLDNSGSVKISRFVKISRYKVRFACY